MEQSNSGVQETKATKIHNALIYLKDTAQAVRELEQEIKGEIPEARDAKAKTPILPLAALLEDTALTLYKRCDAINLCVEEIKKILF